MKDGRIIAIDIAEKEVNDWIGRLGIRKHKLTSKEFLSAIPKVIEMVSFGIAKLDDKSTKVTYVLETELSDGTKEVTFSGKRFSVDEIKKHTPKHGGETEKALTVLSNLFDPILNSGYIGGLKNDFNDLEAIATFFLPI